MNFLYDLTACHPHKTAKFHGGGVYAKIVFDELVKKGKQFSALYDSMQYLDSDIFKVCNESGVELIDIHNTSLTEILTRHSVKCFYSAQPYNLGNIDFKDTICIGTIHGLRPLEMLSDSTEPLYSHSLKSYCKSILKQYLFKGYLKRKYYMQFKELFQNRNFEYVAVSNHTKYSIMSFFPNISNVNIRVLYSPNTIFDKERVLPPKNTAGKYYLLVSGDRWLKNDYRAIIALDRLFTERTDIEGKVIVVGITENVRYYRKIRNKDRFIFKGYVDYSTLLSLYADAYLFIYPTLNEGFGYPPLEAMSFGVPVISSGLSSLSEVLDNSVVYFNPYSIGEIKNRILMFEDNNIYDDYSRRALSRSQWIKKRQKEDLDSLVTYLSDFM